MLPFSASAATPTISNVSGTVANGQTLTIMGTNMVQENTSIWDTVIKNNATNDYGFEGTIHTYIANGSPGWANAFATTASGAFAPVYDSTTKLQGSQSLKMHVYGNTGCSPNCGGSGMTSYPLDSQSNYYARWYARFNVVNNHWPDNYIKQMQFQPGSGNISGFDIGGNSSIIEYFNGSSFSSTATLSPGLQNNRWYCFEVETHDSPRSFKMWIDNQPVITNGVPAYAVNTSFNNFGIINYDDNPGNGTAPDVTEWWDNFTYGPTSRIYPSSTIEISGDGGTTWKWQPPTNLSDTSIAVSEELPTLTAANYKLRITNNQQQVSSVYTLGSADTTPPAAPSGLSVQ